MKISKKKGYFFKDKIKDSKILTVSLNPNYILNKKILIFDKFLTIPLG